MCRRSCQQTLAQPAFLYKALTGLCVSAGASRHTACVTSPATSHSFNGRRADAAFGQSTHVMLDGTVCRMGDPTFVFERRLACRMAARHPKGRRNTRLRHMFMV